MDRPRERHHGQVHHAFGVFSGFVRLGRLRRVQERRRSVRLHPRLAPHVVGFHFGVVRRIRSGSLFGREKAVGNVFAHLAAILFGRKNRCKLRLPERTSPGNDRKLQSTTVEPSASGATGGGGNSHVEIRASPPSSHASTPPPSQQSASFQSAAEPGQLVHVDPSGRRLFQMLGVEQPLQSHDDHDDRRRQQRAGLRVHGRRQIHLERVVRGEDRVQRLQDYFFFIFCIEYVSTVGPFQPGALPHPVHLPPRHVLLSVFRVKKQ